MKDKRKDHGTVDETTQAGSPVGWLADKIVLNLEFLKLYTR